MGDSLYVVSRSGLKISSMLDETRSTVNRQDWPRAWANITSPFTFVLALGCFAMALRTVADPDVWWHLRTGQLIWRNHAIFRTDPFSYTRFGQPWINHEWLTDTTMYVVYTVGSWTALSILFAAFASAALMIAYARCKARPAIAALVTVCGAAAAMPSLGVRPQVISFLFASLFLWILDRSSNRPKVLLWLLPLTLLWVNLHAGYLVGIAFVLLSLFGAILNAALSFETSLKAREESRNLVLTLLGCLAVVPINPYGAAMYWYPFVTLGSPAMQSAIREWASPNFHATIHSPTLWAILALFFLLATRPQKLSPRDVSFLAIGIIGSLLSVRHIPLFVLITIPLASRLLDSGPAPAANKASNGRWRLAFTLLLTGGMLSFVAGRLMQIQSQQAQSEATNYPERAATFLLGHVPEGRMLNSYDWGGYLIWRLYPKYPVFIDGRADVYGDSLINEDIASYYLRNDWDKPIQEWGITTALLPLDAALVQGLRERGWKQVYADSQAVILRK